MKHHTGTRAGSAVALITLVLLLAATTAALTPALAQGDPWVARPTTITSKVDSCTTNWDSLATGGGPFTLILANYGGSAGQILYAAYDDSTGTTHQLRVVQGEARLVLENIRATEIKTKGSAGFLRGIYLIKR